MANNNAIYNGVLSGVTGGSQQRWNKTVNPASYNDFLVNALLLADGVDAAIPTDVAIGPAQGRLISDIVSGLYTTRFLSGPPSAEAIAVIVAQYTKIAEGLLPEAGPTPPDLNAYLNRKVPVAALFDTIATAYNNFNLGQPDTDLLLVRLTTAGNVEFTGWQAPAAGTNSLIAIQLAVAVDAGATCTFNQGGNPGNFVTTPTGKPVVLRRNETMWMWYAAGLGWYVIALSQVAQSNAPLRTDFKSVQFADLQVLSGVTANFDAAYVIEFTNPLPTSYYSAQALGEMLVNGADGSSVLVNMSFEVSIDNGPWVQTFLGETSIQRITQSGNSYITTANGNLPRSLGSALGVAGGTTSLRIRPIATGSAYDVGASVFLRSQGNSGSWSFIATEYRQ